MFDKNFDPYDALIRLNERVNRLETVHNRLAHDYQKSQSDLNIALNSLQNLQRSYLQLSELITLMQK